MNKLPNIRILGHFSSEYHRTFPHFVVCHDINDMLFDDERRLPLDIIDKKTCLHIIDALNKKLRQTNLVVIICSFLPCTTFDGVTGMPVIHNGKYALRQTTSLPILVFDEVGFTKPLLSDLISERYNGQISMIIMLAKSKNKIPQLIKKMVDNHYEL